MMGGACVGVGLLWSEASAERNPLLGREVCAAPVRDGVGSGE